MDANHTTLTPHQAEYAEALTQEIFTLLVAEMQLDFELLVNRDAANLQEPMQLQGIKTDLFAIEKYVDEIITEIKTKDHKDFLQLLNAPLSKEHLQ